MENEVDINECRQWKVTGACKLDEQILVYTNHLVGDFLFLILMKILNSCPLSDGRSIYLTVLFDCLIIIMCIISFALCTRSVITGIQLQLVSKTKRLLLLRPKTGCDCLIHFCVHKCKRTLSADSTSD